jgi:hypothetical protein
MNTLNELSRRELLALKEIQLTGQTTDCTIMLQLLADNMIASFKDGCLKLTDKGRRMLVRGSPSLWDTAS